MVFDEFQIKFHKNVCVFPGKWCEYQISNKINHLSMRVFSWESTSIDRSEFRSQDPDLPPAAQRHHLALCDLAHTLRWVNFAQLQQNLKYGFV